MQIQGCAYEGLVDRLFVTSEYLFCGNCGSLQKRTGLVTYAGHLRGENFCGDILVWTRPFSCLYCNHIIRDLIVPCGDYILSLENCVLPTAC